MQRFRREARVAADISCLGWYFSIIRWVPLGIFLGVSVTDLITQLRQGSGIDWLFPLVCLLFGVLLFRLGTSLQHSNLSHGDYS